jgi:hypothetical protein
MLFLLRYLLSEPFRLIEVYIYERKINKHNLTMDPIFILGHWRSGTSFLQNLLNTDPRFTSISIYEFLFSDTSIVTKKWLKPILNQIIKFFKIPYSFQRVPLDLDIVGELDTGLCSFLSSWSYTWGMIFPKNHKFWMKKLVYYLTDEDAEKWLIDLELLIKKSSFTHKTKRVIVKSPGDTARIPFLLKKYPNASFIYIKRDPVDVFLSTQYLWGIIQKENSFQTLAPDKIDDLIYWNYKNLLQKYAIDKGLIPKGQLIEISFSELQLGKLDTMENIYNTLHLGDVPSKELSTFIEHYSGYVPKEYKPSYELKERIKSEWGSVL